MAQPHIAKIPITPALDKILFSLYQYHLLTTDLVVPAVGSPGSATTVKQNIRILEQAKYLYRFPLATTAGRSPLVCVLAENGMKYLRDDRGLEIAFYRSPAQWKGMSSSWLMHPLELNKFLIAANRLPTVTSQVSVSSWEHDYLLKSSSLVYHDEHGKAHGVVPDAIINFTVPKRRVVWVELERDSHSKKAFEEKFTNIYYIIAKGIFEERYNAKLVKVCFFSTVDEEHVAWMRMIARKSLLAITGKSIDPKSYRNKLFHFAAIPPLQGNEIDPVKVFLEPYWYHPYDGEGQRNEVYPLLAL